MMLLILASMSLSSSLVPCRIVFIVIEVVDDVRGWLELEVEEAFLYGSVCFRWFRCLIVFGGRRSPFVWRIGRSVRTVLSLGLLRCLRKPRHRVVRCWCRLCIVYVQSRRSPLIWQISARGRDLFICPCPQYLDEERESQVHGHVVLEICHIDINECGPLSLDLHVDVLRSGVVVLHAVVAPSTRR